MMKTLPDDLNGDVLREMLEGGDTLTTPRDVDFSLLFRDELPAQAFCRIFRERGFKVELTEVRDDPDLPWDVTVTCYMIPDHTEITAFEAELQTQATPLGGINDGWGCFRIT